VLGVNAGTVMKPNTGTIIQSIPVYSQETHAIKESDSAAI